MTQLMLRLWVKLYCCFLLLLTFGARAAHAQSITPANDGTGTAVSTSDDSAQYDISGGTQAGGNLFHSFEQFGLDQGQIANFLSNPDIDNILSRVVGGDASVIDGLIQVTGGQSNLFLMNPAGVLFGPNARLNIPADFTATTANGIQIDDYWFNAIGSNDYANLVGTPSSFAFTSGEPGAVINAGELSVSHGESVTLLGGFVVNTGTIEAPGGNITIASVPGEDLVSISPEGSLLSLGLPIEEQAGLNTSSQTLTAQEIPALLSGSGISQNLGLVVEDGVVKLASTDTTIPTDSGTTIVSNELNAVDTAADGSGGTIDVLGERIGLLDAALDASGTNGGGDIRIGGEYQGGGPIANAEHTYIDSGSTIASDALINGNGGRVIVWADDTTQFLGSVTARGGPESGDGGFVEVSGRDHLAFNGIVDVSAPAGLNGELLLDPRNVVIGSIGTDNPALNDSQIFPEDGGGDTFFISGAKVVEILESSNVNIAASERITVGAEIDASNNAGENDLMLSSALILLNDSIFLNNGEVAFDGPIFVGNDVTVSTGSEGGDIVFRATLNGVDGNQALTLFAGTGDIEFLDSVGAYRNIPGSNALTFQVADVDPSFSSTFTVVGNLVYFAADDGLTGIELWRSNGTTEGTSLVEDINPGSESSFPSGLTNVDGLLFFAADDGTNGGELWRSDGTEPGTFLVEDINPGSESSSPNRLTNVDEFLFFTADNGINGRELWRSNGTEPGTFLVEDINPGNESSFEDEFSSSSNELTNVNELLFFAADDGTNGKELWRSNGTEAGTFLVEDINSGNGSSSDPANLTNVDGILFFTADNGINGEELWRSNGTEVGTFLVEDIGSDNFSLSAPANLTNVDGILFFTADDDINGRELWRSDGTENGTFLVKDITPGDFSFSAPANLTNVDGILFFTADDGINGEELWRSDGTELGTSLVTDINLADDSSSNPSNLTNVDGVLFFTANDGINGEELWRSDGTEPGTSLVANINPSSRRFDEGPGSLTNFSGELLFSANNGQDGQNFRQLWRSNGIPVPSVLGSIELIIKGVNNVNFSDSTELNSSDSFFVDSININSTGDINFYGDINTTDQGRGIILDANGNITTGGINTAFRNFGPVNISTGGNFLARNNGSLVDIDGQSVNIVAENNITTGNIVTSPSDDEIGNSTEEFVNLTTRTGNIRVGYILAGAGGINIDSAGLFQSLNARPASINRTDSPPPSLRNFINGLGYTDFPALLFIDNFLVSLESVDGSITIRYGQNRETLFPLQDGILIEGDPNQRFIIGPNYSVANPFEPSNFQELDIFDNDSRPINFDLFDSASNPNGYFPDNDGDSVFSVRANGVPLNFPSSEFPNNVSGLVAGISSTNTDSSLQGSLQSRVFGNDNEQDNIPPDPSQFEIANAICENERSTVPPDEPVLTIDESLLPPDAQLIESSSFANPCGDLPAIDHGEPEPIDDDQPHSFIHQPNEEDHVEDDVEPSIYISDNGAPTIQIFSPDFEESTHEEQVVESVVLELDPQVAFNSDNDGLENSETPTSALIDNGLPITQIFSPKVKRLADGESGVVLPVSVP
ncbi:MAG: ELWxxDGT repeat protein [Cyanobacteria bacterium P01_D01_bin.156]